MPRDIDVFQLLKTFALRNKTSSIEYLAFSQAIQRQAKSYDQSEPFYRDLAIHPDGILIPKLFQLAKDKRVSLQAVENRIDMIFFPETFTEAIYAEYRRIEDNPEIPFPDEQSLKLSVPPEWIQAVSVESDLPAMLMSEADRPVPLYRLVFPEGLKPMVILSIAIGDKLLEYSVFKLRNYLRKGSNKDFIQQRLMGAFSSRERMVKDGLSAILIRPFDSIKELRESTGDFVYSFWAYLTTAIRKDLVGKGEAMPDDIAANQASYIVDVYNNFYKTKIQRQQDRDAAFKALLLLLRKPPYLYSIAEIVDFRDSKAHPLLGKYTREELEDWLQDRTTEAVEGTMPELILLATGQAAGRIVAKDRLFPYLLKAIREARVAIKPLLTRDWQAIKTEFGSVPAMEDDAAFRADLDKRLEAQAPMLWAILASPIAPLVYQEYRGGPDATPELDAFFGFDKVAGTDVILGLERKRFLGDVQMLLPIWYSIPIISWVMALVARLRKNHAPDKPKAAKQAKPEPQEAPRQPPPNARAAEFGQAAREAEKRMLPAGWKLDDYLRDLVGRWNTLIDPVAKANLTEDINSLVRDYLRNALRAMRPSSFTPERIETMAATIADRPNLLRIRNHSALEEYVRLYMIKALKR